MFSELGGGLRCETELFRPAAAAARAAVMELLVTSWLRFGLFNRRFREDWFGKPFGKRLLAAFLLLVDAITAANRLLNGEVPLVLLAETGGTGWLLFETVELVFPFDEPTSCEMSCIAR